MKKIYAILGVVVLASLAVASVYFLFFASPVSKNGATDVNIASTTDQAVVSVRAVPPGMREYTDQRYKFSLLYPEALEVNTVDEGGGASTITFQNPSAGQGFQIFIVPFFEEQITDERFKRDVPSGVRTNVEEVMVDGAKGSAFYSRDLVLGETREVWFLKGGYLYEVTTLKALEADLLEVLKTWQFLP